MTDHVHVQDSMFVKTFHNRFRCNSDGADEELRARIDNSIPGKSVLFDQNCTLAYKMNSKTWAAQPAVFPKLYKKCFKKRNHIHDETRHRMGVTHILTNSSSFPLV